MSRNPVLYKSLVVGVIFLFIGVGIQPAIGSIESETEIEIEPKNYLFQTIIDIANNPKVKELFKHYDPDLFKVDIDRSVYCKLLLRNPRLMFNTLFTKPSLSVEYLNKCFNNGIEFTNIIGENNVLEMIESIKFAHTEISYNLNSIIIKDEDLSNRIVTLREMNKEIKPDKRWQPGMIICTTLLLSLAPLILYFFFVDEVYRGFEPYVIWFSLMVLLFIPTMIIGCLYMTNLYLLILFCG